MRRGRPARWLVLFGKWPALGRVKRRLGVGVGAVEARRCYVAMAGAVMRPLLRDPRWSTVLALAPDRAPPVRRPFRLAAGPLHVAGQGGGDLGRRMDRAMRRLPPGPVVLVGTDVPGIRPAYVAAAFAALGRRPFVLGPAEDGGYWLVGARRRPRFPYVFGGVRWSGPQALADTAAGIRRATGTPPALVAQLADLDDAAAWRRWRRHGARM